MRIVGHIHTFNDEEVIDRSLHALLRQTCPVDEIILVDNGSTDGTLARPFPKQVTVIRHPDNQGTSGAVVTGMQYALANRYDWIWVLDADSMPTPRALEYLITLYQSFPSSLRDQVWCLSSLPVEMPRGAIITPSTLSLIRSVVSESPQPRYGVLFTSKGYTKVTPEPGKEAYEMHASIWSGCLFKLQAIQKIGLPPAEYCLDFGEYAYGYQAMRSGYKAFMHQGSIVMHNITGEASLSFRPYTFMGVSFRMVELPPIRCYYVVRNILYFWLYVYHVRNRHTLMPRIAKIGVLILNFLLRPISHWAHLKACLRGFWDGVFKNIRRQY